MSEYRLQYWWAIINVTTGQCIGTETTSFDIDTTQYPEYVRIEGNYPEYMDKWYINGEWYEDEAGTIPWSPVQ